MPTLAWAWHPGKSVMAMRLLTTVRFDGDRDFAAHAASALRGGRRSLFLAIGQLGMASAGERLTTVLRQDGAVRSGRLAASLRGGATGRGGPDTIFEATRDQVEVGSNLRYAAQVHYGGTIYPKPPNKALAIPLTDKLRRAGEWPRDIDPDRLLLTFVPKKTPSNVIGYLVDFGQVRTTKSGRLSKAKPSRQTPYGTGALFALASWVEQTPRPFLYWSDEDVRTINDELVPNWLRRHAGGRS